MSDFKELPNLIGTPWVKYGMDKDLDGGLDCWGAVRTTAKLCFNQDLPRFEKWVARCALRLKIGVETFKHEFIEVEDDPQPGDLVVFNMAGKDIDHIGIMIDKEKFLHSYEGGHVCLSRLSIYTRRLKGVFRWAPH